MSEHDYRIKGLSGFLKLQSSDILVANEQEYRKDLILKYCYALEKGGFLLVAFDFSGRVLDEKETKQYPHIIDQPLSPHSPRQKVTVQKQAEEITRTLEKRGFKAKFTIDQVERDYYRIYLAIQRIK